MFDINVRKSATALVLLTLMLISAAPMARAESNYWAEFGGRHGVVNEVGSGYVIVDGRRMSLPATAPVLDDSGARLSVSALSQGQWIQMWFNPAYPPDRPVLQRIVIRGVSGEQQ